MRALAAQPLAVVWMEPDEVEADALARARLVAIISWSRSR